MVISIKLMVSNADTKVKISNNLLTFTLKMSFSTNFSVFFFFSNENIKNYKVKMYEKLIQVANEVVRSVRTVDERT